MSEPTNTTNIPYLGQPVTVRNIPCVITKILPFGTIEAEALNGPQAFRISGLSFMNGGK